jgi:hypothetical protein
VRCANSISPANQEVHQRGRNLRKPVALTTTLTRRASTDDDVRPGGPVTYLAACRSERTRSYPKPACPAYSPCPTCGPALTGASRPWSANAPARSASSTAASRPTDSRASPHVRSRAEAGAREGPPGSPPARAEGCRTPRGTPPRGRGLDLLRQRSRPYARRLRHALGAASTAGVRRIAARRSLIRNESSKNSPLSTAFEGRGARIFGQFRIDHAAAAQVSRPGTPLARVLYKRHECASLRNWAEKGCCPRSGGALRFSGLLRRCARDGPR